MSLIALMMGSMQFTLPHFLKEESFIQESSKIKHAIHFAQEVMMDTKSDLMLTLINEEGRVHLDLSSSKELPERMASYLVDSCGCKEVEQMFFNGEKTKKLILHFEGHLGRISEGVITLENKKGKQQKIVLRGFPGNLL